jgi:hypothetical protein
MADLSSLAQTVNNSGSTVATLTTNFGKHVINQADVGREFILSITAASGQLTDAKLKACIAYLTTAHGSAGTGDSAGTVAALGTTDGTAFAPGVDTVVVVRYQTTADFTITGVNASATDTVVAILAELKPAL